MFTAITSREIHVRDSNEAGSWEGIREPGETMEWQGAPVQGLFWELPHWQTAGILALGLASAPLHLAGQNLHAEAAAVFFLWGLIDAIWVHARSLWDRRRTFYSLTNRRAFIATSHLGVMRLQAWPLAELADLRLVERVPGHVLLTTEKVVRSRQDGQREETVVIGFMNLADPRPVYELVMRLRHALMAETADGGDRSVKAGPLPNANRAPSSAGTGTGTTGFYHLAIPTAGMDLRAHARDNEGRRHDVARGEKVFDMIRNLQGTT